MSQCLCLREASTTKFLLRLLYTFAMDPLYFEPLDLSATILTAPTGWSCRAAKLCAIREASTNYYILLLHWYLCVQTILQIPFLR